MAEQIKKFPARLKELLATLDLEQKEFADQIGFSRSAVGTYLRRQRMPHTVALYCIAKRFKVSMDWLLGLDDKAEVVGSFKCPNCASVYSVVGSEKGQ
jgi:transcriptional regulator with XRE-family HTH domain